MLGTFLEQRNDELYEFVSKAPSELGIIPDLAYGFKEKIETTDIDIIKPIALLTKMSTATKQRMSNPFFGTIYTNSDDIEDKSYIDNQYIIQQLVECGYMSKNSRFPASFNTLEEFYFTSKNEDMLFKIDGLDLIDDEKSPVYIIIGAKFNHLPSLKEIEVLCSKFYVGLSALSLRNMQEDKESYNLLNLLRQYKTLITLPIIQIKPELEFYITNKQAALKSVNKINLDTFRMNWMFYNEEETE